MMVELRPSEFERVLPLYRDTGMTFPLISSVIQGDQRGQILANDLDELTGALVVANFGFTFFVGKEDERFHEELIRLFGTGNELRPSYLLWYSPPETWHKVLDDVAPDAVKRRQRIRYNFSKDHAGWMNEPVVSPPGFELKNLSFELLPKTEKFQLKLDSRFWTSADEVVNKSLGVCLVKDGEVASLCYAAAVVDGLAEVDVVTDNNFRGQGLATSVAREFINQCLSRGITPTWDCFDYNTGSVKLAQKLGFVEVTRYPFYSFNMPLSLE